MRRASMLCGAGSIALLGLLGCGEPTLPIEPGTTGATATATGSSSERETGSTGSGDSQTTQTPATSGSTTEPLPTTSADESSTSAASIGFIPSSDGGGVSFECGILEQDCPAGEKCMPWANDGGNSWNATRCAPLAPDPVGAGEACTAQESGVSGVDDCDAASMCWGVDQETSVGKCVPFCVGSNSDPICEDPRRSCSINGDGTLILCLPNCDPVVQDCEEGMACYDTGQGFLTCAPDASGKSGADGDPCEFVNACDSGLGCVNRALVDDCSGSFGCCTPFCDTTQPESCTAPLETCVPLFEPGAARPGTANYGFCGLEE